jgi:Putative beta-barrel porin-2, OmpL-like. bbp2
MRRFAAGCKSIVLLCLLALAGSPVPCLAQNNDSAKDAAKPAAHSGDTTAAKGTDESIPPAVAKELDELRARIAALEALVKAKNAQEAASAPANAAAGTAAGTAATINPSVPPPAPAPTADAAAASDNASGGTAGAAGALSTTTDESQPSGSATLQSSAGQGTSAATATQGQPNNASAAEPFSFADFTWLNGNARTKELAFDTPFFTPEIRADVDYVYDFNKPIDHTIGGSSEIFRSGEVQLTQLGVGGDFHWDNVRARLMTQFGMYAATTPRNDASPGLGNWDLDTAYRYVSEAYGGYHFNVLHGLNVDAGIFLSYIGLFSFYNFDNWAYQPSYVSSNTPWFFNGLRVQLFPTEKLKVEYWYINGWQSYGKFNKYPGMGGQIIYRPKAWLAFIFNNYGMGTDTLFNPNRSRIHTDDSVEVKYYDNPERTLDRMAFSLTGDAGCEYGGGVTCTHNGAGGPKQSFLGFMFYNRWWLHNDLFGVTLGGGKINNPGRYLVLLPPINGATAISGTPYFTENPGDQFKAWDASLTFDYMPKQYITFRWEADTRGANVPYFTGPGGITPPGGNQGAPGSLVPGWTPDLRNHETRIEMAILVKF